MKSCCNTRGLKTPVTKKGEAPKGRLLPLKIGVVVLLGITAMGGTLYYMRSTAVPDRVGIAEAQAATAPAVAGGEVMYPESAFADGKAKFFSYKTPGGKTVRYFVIKSSDGVIRAAFDACDVCYEAGKGYFQQDDFMVCRNCGRRFQSTKVNVVTGGCNPSALTRTLKDGKVLIPAQALNEGSKFF